MKAAEMKERPTFTLMKQTDVQSIYHMQMPRWLFSDPRYADMSLDAKVAYTFLLNRFQLSRRNGWVNEHGEMCIRDRSRTAKMTFQELSEGRPQDFSVKCQSPELLRFTLEGSSLRLFAVVTISDPLHTSVQARDSPGRIVWISDSGTAPPGLVLPPKHFFAARQPDGSHRFYGS